ncbi:hypothetical protein [Terrabacter carboxydivorans]|uniref:Uncharacterized protein n=1 Tax=Terrabacter carboxydivorans TaxID=619730 RepID=A0ABP5Y922_9MICO
MRLGSTTARPRVESAEPTLVLVHGRRTSAADYDGVTWNLTLFPPGASLAIRRTSGRPVSAPSALDLRQDPLKTLDEEVAELGQLIVTALNGPPPPGGPHPAP